MVSDYILEGSILFKRCVLEEQLRLRYSVAYLCENISDMLICKITLDGIVWFELIATPNSTTINLSSKTFLLKGNSFVLDSLEMSGEPQIYSVKDLDDDFTSDLIYPALNSISFPAKEQILDIITLISSKLSYAKSNITDRNRANESPERELMKSIVSKALSHYAVYSSSNGRDREFEESVLTAKLRLDLK